MRLLDRVVGWFGYTKTATIANPPAWLTASAEAERWEIPLDGSLPESQAELYQKLSWVQIAVAAVAQMAATTPLGVQQLQGEEASAVQNHPLELLLRRPNPLDSRYEFMEATFAYKLITGTAYWWLNRPSEDRPPAELWLLPPHKVRPVPDGRMYLRGYIYDAGFGREIALEPWEVVQFRRFHPLSRWQGLSPLEALEMTTKGDLAMQRWNTNYFAKDNAKPAGALAYADPIDDSSWNRMKMDIRDQHGGTKRSLMMLRNVGKGGVSWLNMAMSQKDMEFLAGRTFNKEEIFSLYAPGLSSVLAVNATEANATTGKGTFVEMAVWPQLTSVAEKITNDLLPAYGDNLVAAFDDIRVTDRQLLLSEQAAFERVHTIDEVRAKFYQADPLGDERGNLLIGEIGKGLTNAEPARPEPTPTPALPPALPDQSQADVPPPDQPGDQPAKAALKAASVKMNTGAMVAFFMPPDVMASLAIAQQALPINSAPVAPGELHLTLLMLGDVQQLSPDAIGAINDALGQFAATMPPIHGRINGIGRFHNTDTMTDALYASFDSRELSEWRTRLAELLRSVGIETPSEHGFIPHITLGYVPTDAVTPMLGLPGQDFTLDAVWLALGDVRQSWLLEGESPNAAKLAEIKRFRKWLKRRANPDVTQFKSDILSDAEKAAFVHEEDASGGEDSPFAGKATRNLPGADGNDRKRKELEGYHADKIGQVFRRILRAIVPPGTDETNITPDQAMERYRQNEKLLRDALVAMLLDGAHLGGETAMAQINALMGVGKAAVNIVGADWDLINEAVLRWVLGTTGGGFGQYNTDGGYVDSITLALTQTNERLIRAQIAEWVQNNLTLQQLTESLTRTVFSEQRAEMIAVTEITRAYVEGNRLAFQQSGVVERAEIQTAHDERVCPVCGPRHGRQVSLETGDPEIGFPPFHPRCRCWIIPVVGASNG